VQEIKSSLAANVEWLVNMDMAVDQLASKCLESDASGLRHDADAVHLLCDDISSRVQQLIERSAEAGTQSSEVCSGLQFTIVVVVESRS